MTNPIEQRRFVRLKIDVRLQVSTVLNAQQQTSLARGHDVGLGGLSAYIPMELPQGQKLLLQFELPYSRMKFNVEAVVRNSNGFRYGLEFMQLADKEREEIERVSKILHLTTSA